jgi:hypothetical protein
MVFFLAALPYVISGVVVVTGVVIYTVWGAGRDAAWEAAAAAVENTGLLIMSILYSGYVLVFGFPGYLIDSAAHGMIDYIDPLRYTSIDWPSSLDIGKNRTTMWSLVTDSAIRAVHIPNAGSAMDDILGLLRIKGTSLPTEVVSGHLVIPNA